MDFETVIKERYSLRKYDTEHQVEEEKLNKILEAGRICPTAKNKQSQRVFVIRSKELKEKISQLGTDTFSAPLLLLVGYDENEEVVFNGNHRGPIDASIATTHMMLEATNLGLGTCWVGGIYEGALKELLGLPENIRTLSILTVGYPGEGAHPAHLHNERNPIEKMVKYFD